MKKNFLILAAAVAALTLASCKETRKTTEEAANAATEAVQNATQAVEEAVQKIEDFTQNLGTYEGTIAQADGSGFVTELTFNADNTYNCVMTADDGSKFEDAGSFTFDVASQQLTLTDAKDAENVRIFAVEGDKLILCNAEGNLPEIKEMYTLTRK